MFDRNLYEQLHKKTYEKSFWAPLLGYIPYDTIAATNGQKEQVAAALTYLGENTAVRNYAKGRTGTKGLLKAQPLKGKRILNLGCGIILGFDRASGLLGAYVESVDLISPDHLELNNMIRADFLAKRMLRPELVNAQPEAWGVKYIQTDLNDPKFMESLNPPYDMVTSSFLFERDFNEFYKLSYRFWADIHRMLKKGGISFHAFSRVPFPNYFWIKKTNDPEEFAKIPYVRDNLRHEERKRNTRLVQFTWQFSAPSQPLPNLLLYLQ